MAPLVRPIPAPAWSAGAVLGAALLLATPALWNGFPLLYWDSADYIAMPFTLTMPPFRTATYVTITAFGKLTGTLWAVVALQSLIVAWVLHEVVDACIPGKARVALVPLTGLLTLLTALPWFTGQIMPDAFTGILTLGFGVLAFAPPGTAPARQIALIAALTVATAVHTSHIALGLGLVMVFLALSGAARLRGLRSWLTARVALPALVVALGTALATGANWWVTGHTFINQPTGNLLLARLVQDGIAKKYLDAVCPTGTLLRLCPYRDHLPDSANAFLWLPGPFYDIGGWTPEVQAESNRIVAGSLAMFPGEHLKNAAALALAQLFEVKTGDGVIRLDTIYLNESVEKNPFIPKILGAHYPQSLPAYWQSRQRTTIDFEPLNRIQVPLVLAGYLAVIGLLVWALRRHDRLAAGLAITTVLAVLGNAFVCGALSNPNNRYQARIAWTCLVVAGLGAARLRRDQGVTKGGGARSLGLGSSSQP